MGGSRLLGGCGSGAICHLKLHAQCSVGPMVLLLWLAHYTRHSRGFSTREKLAAIPISLVHDLSFFRRVVCGHSYRSTEALGRSRWLIPAIKMSHGG